LAAGASGLAALNGPRQKKDLKRCTWTKPVSRAEGRKIIRPFRENGRLQNKQSKNIAKPGEIPLEKSQSSPAKGNRSSKKLKTL